MPPTLPRSSVAPQLSVGGQQGRSDAASDQDSPEASGRQDRPDVVERPNDVKQPDDLEQRSQQADAALDRPPPPDRALRNEPLPSGSLPNQPLPSGPGAGALKFPPEVRIRRLAEYRALREHAKRVHTRHFVILIRPHDELAATRLGVDQTATRLGITVTKRVGNAVARNRVKRVAREVFRRERNLFPAGCDVVLIARAGSPKLGYGQVEAELAQAQRPMERAAHIARAAPEGSRC
jgi:ribonuclease P protein component